LWCSFHTFQNRAGDPTTWFGLFFYYFGLFGQKNKELGKAPILNAALLLI
jgi:hypothetical protein